MVRSRYKYDRREFLNKSARWLVLLGVWCQVPAVIDASAQPLMSPQSYGAGVYGQNIYGGNTTQTKVYLPLITK